MNETIEKQVESVLASLPAHVTLVAAAKTRSVEEVMAAIRGGIRVVGYNYIQEAEKMRSSIDDSQVEWHMIGHLQRNKAKHAARIFDMVETLDNVVLGEVLDRRCAMEDKVMPVLLEVNSGRESQKSGIFPEEIDELAEKLSQFTNLRISGLMTMGPPVDDAEQSRSFFRATRQAFDRLAKSTSGRWEMQYLSMGMSDSYLIAIEEGANMVRLGTKLFGPRVYPDRQ